ncbi:MAG TPA: hypothetical protein VFC46_00655 [Humisphaera sp.]|nr:hypothetical protein [Humisphaera sp.]
MKQVLFIPIALAIAAAVGYLFMRLIRWPIHVREMNLAMAPSLISGIAALAPALLRRPFGAAAVVQGAYYGIIIHMVMSLFLAIVVFVGSGIQGSGVTPYALWLLWFFWVSLAAVAASLISLIRAAPVVLAKK